MLKNRVQIVVDARKDRAQIVVARANRVALMGPPKAWCAQQQQQQQQRLLLWALLGADGKLQVS